MNSKRFEIFTGGAKRDRYYWRFRTANGKIIAIGGEGYRTRRNVTRAIKVLVGEITAGGGLLPTVEVEE